MSYKKSRKHIFGRGAGGGVNLGLIITPMLDMAFQLLAFFIMTYHPPAYIGFIETERAQLPADEKDKGEGKEKKKQDRQKEIKKKEDKGVGDKLPDKAQEKKVEMDLPPDIVEDSDPEFVKKGDFLRVEVLAVKSTDKDYPDYLETGDPISIQIYRPESPFAPVLLKVVPAKVAATTKKEKAQARDAFVSALRKELEAELKTIRKKYSDKNVVELVLAVDAELKHRWWMAMYDSCRSADFPKVGSALRKQDRKARE